MTTDGPTVEFKFNHEAMKEINDMEDKSIIPTLLIYKRECVYDNKPFPDNFDRYKTAYTNWVTRRMGDQSRQDINRPMMTNNYMQNAEIRNDPQKQVPASFKDMELLKFSENYVKMKDKVMVYQTTTRSRNVPALFTYHNYFFYSLSRFRGDNNEYNYSWQLAWEWVVLLAGNVKATASAFEQNYYLLQR